MWIRSTTWQNPSARNLGDAKRSPRSSSGLHALAGGEQFDGDVGPSGGSGDGGGGDQVGAFGIEPGQCLVAASEPVGYGLCGSVWTSDPVAAEQIAARMRTGVVAINSSMILDFNSPFGGFKKSGIGRELGPEGIGPYTEYQTIVLPAG